MNHIVLYSYHVINNTIFMQIVVDNGLVEIPDVLCVEVL